MNGAYYTSEKFGRVILIPTIAVLVLSVGIMVVNLRKISKKLDVSAIGLTEKSIIAPIPRDKYDSLVTGFKESYTASGVHARNIFSQSTENSAIEIVPVEIPPSELDLNDPSKRFKAVRIYRKPVKLLFKGYMQMGDGSFVATINWAGKTDFKKVGDEIRGYNVVDFQKKVYEQDTLWGGTERIDQSFVTLERENGERFNLEIGRITLEKEIYAEILDRKDSKPYEIYVGAEFVGNKVLDISSDLVIITTSNGEKVSLKKEPVKN